MVENTFENDIGLLKRPFSEWMLGVENDPLRDSVYLIGNEVIVVDREAHFVGLTSEASLAEAA